MNILVTGGSGFIGTRLVEVLLEAGHSVTIFDKANSSHYPELVTIGDVRDRSALSDALKGMDLVYHLAAEHADDVTPFSLYADVNIGGAINLVEALKANEIKHLIFTSSVAIYGLNRGEPNETFDAQPFNEYGRTKYEAEKIFTTWATEEKSHLTMLRPAVVFGERNRGNVYNLIRQIESGKFMMVGNGENRKSMGYVGNIAAFLAYQATQKEEQIAIYNFAGKPDLTSNEIVAIIKKSLGNTTPTLSLPYSIGLLGGYLFDILAKISGRKFPISSIRIKKFTAETTVDTTKLLESGFVEPFTLEEGLKRMIDYEFIQRELV